MCFWDFIHKPLDQYLSYNSWPLVSLLPIVMNIWSVVLISLAFFDSLKVTFAHTETPTFVTVVMGPANATQLSNWKSL